MNKENRNRNWSGISPACIKISQNIERKKKKEKNARKKKKKKNCE